MVTISAHSIFYDDALSPHALRDEPKTRARLSGPLIGLASILFTFAGHPRSGSVAQLAPTG